MKTPSAILLGIVSSVAVSGVIAFIAFAILRDMDAEVRRRHTLSEIGDKTRSLHILTASDSEGAVQADIRQVRGLLQSLDGLLKNLPARSPREEVLIEQLRKSYNEVAPLIEQWFASARAAKGVERERQDLLASQIWINAQFISDDTRRLKDIAEARIFVALQRTEVSLIGLIVLLAIINGVIYVLSVRSMARAQRASVESAQRAAADLQTMTRLRDVGGLCARPGNDFHGCLNEILDAAIALTGADKGNIQLHDETGALKIAAQRGFQQPFLNFFASVREGHAAACGAAVQFLQRVIVEDVNRSEIFAGQPSLDVLLKAGVRAVQSTPLTSSAGKVLGMVSTHFSQPHRPRERELRLMDLLARQAADYLERKQAEEALAMAQRQLEDHALKLERTVSERTAKLQEIIGELESFSYSIVHDMRGPLRAMLNYAKLLAAECTPQLNADGRDYVRRIATSAERMDRLIVDVLAYSSVARAELKLQPVDLAKLIDGILESYPHFQPPSVNISVEPPLPAVLANEAALTQVISNLLANAVKFVAPGSTPRIRIWSEPVSRELVAASHQSAAAQSSLPASRSVKNPEDFAFIRLFFQDNGIGIEPAHHEKIFGIFEKLHPAYEGTGIGLAIVKKALERMDGRAGLHSEPGKGTTFWIELRAAD